MAKATTATAGMPGTFDGDQPATVGEIEALTADPQDHWPEGSWVETEHGGERYWDGEGWETGRAPTAPGVPGPEPEDDEPEPIVAAAMHQRKMKAY